MPTHIKELPTKEWLLEHFYEEDGFIYWKHKEISRGRKSTRGGKRITTWIDPLGYYRVGINRQTYMLSRLVYQMHHGDLTTEFEIDHIDQDKSNNTISNLRKVAQEVNKRNKPQPINTGSGFTGVCRNSKRHPFPHQDKITEYYVARWYDLDGNLKGKYFRIDSHGEEEAFRLACEYRAKMIAELNEQGAGYTDRHGT